MARVFYPLMLLALAGLVALAGTREDRAPLSAVAVASAAGGSLEVWNTRSGEALFRAERLAPGDSTTGVVSIGNAGTVSGFFSLTQASLADRPGPGGGLLSERLELAVTDVSVPGAPLDLYRGKLSEMTSQPIGYLAPGEARTFKFTARFPESAGVAVLADQALAGSAASISYRWLAIGADNPSAPAPAPPALAADRRAPKLKLTLPRAKRWLTGRRVLIHARCDEACALTAHATLRLGRTSVKAPLRTRTLAAGKRTPLAVKLSPKWRSIARRALAAKRGARLTVTADAHDAAANKTHTSRKLKMPRKPRARR